MSKLFIVTYIVENKSKIKENKFSAYDTLEDIVIPDKLIAISCFGEVGLNDVQPLLKLVKQHNIYIHNIRLDKKLEVMNAAPKVYKSCPGL